MENKLEQLLNSLIEKGWCPRGEREPIYMLSSKKLYIPDTIEVNRSLRDLVSKESMLWQFVCENGMIYEKDRKRKEEKLDTFEYPRVYEHYEYQYRLIESSLKDESELESFILDNIKIDVESK